MLEDLFHVVSVSAAINDGWFKFQSGQYTDNKNNHLSWLQKNLTRVFEVQCWLPFHN